jgi:hypothetical protein
MLMPTDLQSSPNEHMLMLHMMMYNLVNRNHSIQAPQGGKSNPGTGALVPARGGVQPIDIRCGTTLDGRIELERDECLKGCLS